KKKKKKKKNPEPLEVQVWREELNRTFMQLKRQKRAGKELEKSWKKIMHYKTLIDMLLDGDTNRLQGGKPATGEPTLRSIIRRAERSKMGRVADNSKSRGYIIDNISRKGQKQNWRRPWRSRGGERGRKRRIKEHR